MTWWNHIAGILDPTGTLPVGVQLTEDHEPDYSCLLWGSTDVPKPTEEEFYQAVEQAKRMTYRDDRREAYPALQEQLDILYHHGIDGWRAAIQAVKDEFPKPDDRPATIEAAQTAFAPDRDAELLEESLSEPPGASP